MKKITIRSVAKSCNVSLATVSGILNGRTDFSESTIRMVWEAAHTLGYTPSQSARQLRAGDNVKSPSRLLLHVSNSIDMELDKQPYEMRRSMLLTMASAKYGYLISDYFYSSEDGFKCYPYLNEHFDGIILGSPHDQIITMMNGKLPVVLLDLPSLHSKYDLPSVNMDYRSGISSILNELTKRDHRKISVIYSPSPDLAWIGEDAMIDYTLFLASRLGFDFTDECRFSFPDINKENHDQSMASVFASLEPKIRANKVNAIICANYMYAINIQNALDNAGISREECSCFALNTQYPGEFRFDSICYDWARMTDKAVEILVAKLTNPADFENFQCLIPPILDFH